MYTWGYLQNSILAKLDLDQNEATELKLLDRFTYYANEAMTQICSSVKPKRTYFYVTFYNVIEVSEQGLILDGKLYENANLREDTVYDENGNIVAYPIGKLVVMRSDFGDGRNLRIEGVRYSECYDDCVLYEDYNKVTCVEPGSYKISYNARWCNFNNVYEEDDLSSVPLDVLECIPSYVAHQCYKIDDEYKSSVYRNEYEMFLARLDNSDYDNTTTIKIQGDW